MRRKIIQEFVNSFCQRVLDLPSGYDIASFAHYGSGIYEANILTGACSYNDNPIPSLKLCDVYQKWMHQQLDKHGVRRDGIREATLQLRIEVREVTIRSPRSPLGQRFPSAHFFFGCRSEIKTDEKSYVGHMSGDRKWGFCWYYEQLYGALPEVWPSTSVTT